MFVRASVYVLSVVVSPPLCACTAWGAAAAAAAEAWGAAAAAAAAPAAAAWGAAAAGVAAAAPRATAPAVRTHDGQDAAAHVQERLCLDAAVRRPHHAHQPQTLLKDCHRCDVGKGQFSAARRGELGICPQSGDAVGAVAATAVGEEVRGVLALATAVPCISTIENECRRANQRCGGHTPLPLRHNLPSRHLKRRRFTKVACLERFNVSRGRNTILPSNCRSERENASVSLKKDNIVCRRQLQW